MSFRTPLAIALALGALGLMSKASAYPYLVYSGKITTASSISSAEDLALDAEIKTNGAHYAKFMTLPAVLRTRVGTYFASAGGTVADLVYMVTDESDVSNYAVVIVDPTGYKVISTTVSGSTLTPAEAQNNFISGFNFSRVSSKGGLGLFRFAYSHTTRTDPTTSATGSYVVQASATGPVNDLANLLLVPAKPAEKLRVVSKGVLVETLSLPAHAAIYSPSLDQFISAFTGTVQGFYFDNTSASSIAGTTTAGTLDLTYNVTLTALANDGGGYVASDVNIGWIPPIPATLPDGTAPATAFQTFVNNIIAVYPDTPAP